MKGTNMGRILWLSLTEADLEHLKETYQSNLGMGLKAHDIMEWRGYELLMGYVKYGIEFLEQQPGKDNAVCQIHLKTAVQNPTY